MDSRQERLFCSEGIICQSWPEWSFSTNPPPFFLHPLSPVYIWGGDLFGHCEILCRAVTCSPLYVSLLAGSSVAAGVEGCLTLFYHCRSPLCVSVLPQGWHSYRYRKLITHNDSLVSITNYRKRQIGSRVSYPIPADLDDITLICMFTQTHTQRSTCCPALTCVSCSVSLPEFVIFT